MMDLELLQVQLAGPAIERELHPPAMDRREYRRLTRQRRRRPPCRNADDVRVKPLPACRARLCVGCGVHPVAGPRYCAECRALLSRGSPLDRSAYVTILEAHAANVPGHDWPVPSRSIAPEDPRGRFKFTRTDLSREAERDATGGHPWTP